MSAKVGHIRNELDPRGHNPLLLFLKCLEALHRGILTAERAGIMMPP